MQLGAFANIICGMIPLNLGVPCCRASHYRVDGELLRSTLLPSHVSLEHPSQETT